MVIHPPLLYMGYVGLLGGLRLCDCRLIGGNLDAAWARWTRPWTTAAWVFLTIGIALGSWWAYYELGWGGWWFWDPVENASFMPWLVGTALIHSLAVTEKRGSFKSWTVLLAILAFSLSLLGTFLVRSGVLSSVHAFATDPRAACSSWLPGRGDRRLAGAVRLARAQGRPRAPLRLLSRETLLLANNVLLVVATGAVLLGTLYPLVLDALGMGKISVGPPYFDTVFVPLMAPVVLFLMGVGPAGALEARRAARPGASPALGRGRRVVARWHRGWLAGASRLSMLRPGHGLLDRDLGSPPTCGNAFAGGTSRGAIAAQRPPAAARHGGHDGRPPGRGGLHASASRWSRPMRSSATCDGPGRQHHAGRLHLHAPGPRELQRAQLHGDQGLVEVSRDGKRLVDRLPEKRVYRVQPTR
jgi:cytochrome c-type biogenesis protein CcmF